MIKKIILILLVLGLVLYCGYYFGQKRGFDNGLRQAAQNIEAARKAEIAKLVAQKSAGPNPESVYRAFVGTWQSVREQGVVREFTNAGTYIDFKNNKKINNGTVSVFSISSPDADAAFTLENGFAYVKTREVNTEYPNFYKIQKVTATDLELVPVGSDMSASSSLIFKRIK